MRILFAGSPSLAVPSLEKLARAHEVCAVLASPDNPAGRGRALRSPPVKEAAQGLGLRVLQPRKLDAAAEEEIRGLAPELLAVAAYGRIFRKSFLDIFPRGGINLHPSLLPRYRGPSPIAAAILAGDAESGVTVQRMALEFDTGDILAQERVSLRGEETAGSLTEQLARLGAELLAAVVAAEAEGRPVPARPQRAEEASYCHPLRAEDGAVDWAEPASLIERKVRAYDPWPRARTRLGPVSLLLLKTHVYPGTLDDAARAAPGDVVAADGTHGLLVRTGRGILAVERLQPQFKKPMDWRSFLNGRPDAVGARLGG